VREKALREDNVTEYYASVNTITTRFG